jgi:hypothetical protein
MLIWVFCMDATTTLVVGLELGRDEQRGIARRYVRRPA